MITFDQFEAGPGSYNISNDLARTSSVYHNAPRPVILKAKKTLDSFIPKGSHISFSPVSYISNPNSSFYRSSSCIKFGNEKRKDYFLMSQDRSPGPIYSFPLKGKQGISFTRAKKKDSKTPSCPSPDTYNPKQSPTKIGIKIKGNHSDKVYSKNVEKFLKGGIGPGPAEYYKPEYYKKGIKISKSTRDIKEPCVGRTLTPGPGSYNVLESRSKGCRFTLSKRSLDIRACKIYLDQNSYEFARN